MPPRIDLMQSEMPSLIIEGLYLGAKEHAEDMDSVLSPCGITHIVNATDNLPNLFSEKHCLAHETPRLYCRVPVRDVRRSGVGSY